ncbi:MAG: hypothetical protein HON23_05500 [Rickettsiales bacterium]|jgi:hypothetical protein|nr:hypothetical protein [Rickettsiales bacterium]
MMLIEKKAASSLESFVKTLYAQIYLFENQNTNYTRPEVAKMLSGCFDGLCKDMLEAREIKYDVLCLKTFVTKSSPVDCNHHLCKDAILALLACSPEQDLGSSLIRRGS